MCSTLRLVSFLVVVATIQVVDTEVVEFKGAHFEDELNNFDIILILFYSPSCGHCQKLFPEYVKAAGPLAVNHPPITLAKIDCTEEEGREVCKDQGVSGFPTLKVYFNGKFEFDYEGPRDAGGMVSYMRSKIKPGDVELKTMDEFDRFVDSLENCVIGFFDSATSRMEKEFHKLSLSLSGQYRFAHTSSNAVMKRFGHRNDIVIFRSERLSTKLEQDQVKFEGQLSLYNLRNWVAGNYHGLVGYRTLMNRDQFEAPLAVIYVDVSELAEKGSQTRYWRNRFMMVAKKFTSDVKRVTFAVSDVTEFRRELSDFGLNVSDQRPFITARDAYYKRYTFTEEFTLENLEQFIDNMLTGLLTPHIKTAPPPPDSPPSGDAASLSGVRWVVGKTFESVVNDLSKDVLLLLESPQCGVRCENVVNNWNKLTNKLKDEPDILLARMDAVANELPRPYFVKGYPTIFFAARLSKKKPLLYEGGHEGKDFLKFLAREATTPLQRYDREGKKIKEDAPTTRPPKTEL